MQLSRPTPRQTRGMTIIANKSPAAGTGTNPQQTQPQLYDGVNNTRQMVLSVAAAVLALRPSTFYRFLL